MMASGMCVVFQYVPFKALHSPYVATTPHTCAHILGMHFPYINYFSLLSFTSLSSLAGVKVGPAPGWKCDTAGPVLISDMGDAPGLSTARRGAAPTQNALRVGQMDVMLGVQATGGMAYGAATAALNPEVLYHAGPELEQLNRAWFPHVQHDGMHHHGGPVAPACTCWGWTVALGCTLTAAAAAI